MNNNRLYIFYIGHPAHYYASVALANRLHELKNEILFVVRPRNIVIDLIKNSPYDYVFTSKNDRGSGKIAMIWSILKRELYLTKLVWTRKPFILIGTDITITHIGKIFNIPTIILNEDDTTVVPLLAKYGFRFSSAVLSPNVCNLGQYEEKKIGYEGYHKLLYLTPTEFNKRFRDYKPKINVNEPYFLLRFSSLAAHHDVGIKGIDDKMALKIIKKLERKGKVFISSERPLSNVLEKYRFTIDPYYMHFYLANAMLLISDSQSMSVEAAILGTPSIRFSSFSGKIGVLEELESKYELTHGISPDDVNGLFKIIETKLNEVDLKKRTIVKKDAMLKDKVNVLEFFTWYLNEYPESHNLVKSNRNHVRNFK